MISKRLSAWRRMGSPPASGLDHVPTQVHVTNLRREWRAMAHAGAPGPRAAFEFFDHTPRKNCARTPPLEAGKRVYILDRRKARREIPAYFRLSVIT